MQGAVKERAGHVWARDPHDWYVEPRWVSERLFATEPMRGTVIDPACGLGRIVEAARMSGFDANGYDIVARSRFAHGVQDFLAPNWWAGGATVANIVSNPPFKHAEAFAAKALERAERKVCLLLPAKWMQGDKRSRWLETTPLRRVLAITPRPSMPPGAVVAAGVAVGGGKEDFCWYVWQQDYDGKPELGWLRRDAA